MFNQANNDRSQNAISRLRTFLQKAQKTLKFLRFLEDNPKHQIVKNLIPIHALMVFYFCFLAPTLVFFWLIRYGLILMIIGEMLLVIAVLELMHIMYDRQKREG